MFKIILLSVHRPTPRPCAWPPQVPSQVAKKLLGMCERVELAYIHELEVVFLVTHDAVRGAHREVEVYDAELVGKLIHTREHAR